MTTKQTPTRAAIAHRAAMRATARAVKAYRIAGDAAQHPQSTVREWRAYERASAALAEARTAQEEARAAAYAARVASEAH